MITALAIAADADKMTNSDVGIITRDTPLRLETAARLAFPDGSMKVAGLRRGISRGRLGYELIAGKMYVSLTGIDAMRELCRVQVKVRGSGNVQPLSRTARSEKTLSGSSRTDERKSAQDALRLRVSSRLQK
jgi:hypothetical protein